MSTSTVEFQHSKLTLEVETQLLKLTFNVDLTLKAKLSTFEVEAVGREGTDGPEHAR